MLTLLRLKPFGYCGDWEMECEKVLLVLHYEAAAHRFKFFRRGSCPPRDELLASVCQGLWLAPGTSLRPYTSAPRPQKTLCKRQSWKSFEMTMDKGIHAKRGKRNKPSRLWRANKI